MSNTKQRNQAVINDVDSDEDFDRKPIIRQRKHFVINDIDSDDDSSSARNIEKPLTKQRKQLIRKNIEEEIDMVADTAPQSLKEAKEYEKAMGKLFVKYCLFEYSTAAEEYNLKIIMAHHKDARSARKYFEARDGNDSEDD